MSSKIHHKAREGLAERGLLESVEEAIGEYAEPPDPDDADPEAAAREAAARRCGAMREAVRHGASCRGVAETTSALVSPRAVYDHATGACACDADVPPVDPAEMEVRLARA